MNFKAIMWKFCTWLTRGSPTGELAVASNMEILGHTDFEINNEILGIRIHRMKALRDALVQTPSTQLDPAMVELVKTWDETPKAVQILEVLDQCVHDSLASGFTVSVLQHMYNIALRAENKTHEDVVVLAFWRKS